MKKTRFFIIYAMLIFSIGLSIFLKLIPYYQYNYDYLIGFDTGKYIYDLSNKISTSPYSLDLWVEPSLSTTLSSVNSIANINPTYYYKYIMPIIVSIVFCLIVFTFTKRLTNSLLSSILASLYLSTSIIFLNATFDSFYRQIYGSVIFMVFLYFADKFVRTKKIDYRWSVLFAIFGSGIIFSHRAISLIYVFVAGILLIMLFLMKKIQHIKVLIVSGIGAIVISSVYWLPIAFVEAAILRDSITSSVKGKTGGERIIKTLSRDDNQIIGYLKTVSTSFIPFLGIITIIKKRQFNVIVIFTIIMVFYIYFKAIFANRFMFNLEIFFAVFAGVFFNYIEKRMKRAIFLVIVVAVLVLNFTLSLKTALLRSPYVPYNTASIEWVISHVNKDNSIIIAPDSLSTILTSIGYKTAIYEFPLKTGETDTRFTNTEEFLIKGYKDLSLLRNMQELKSNIYVAFGDWNIYYPLPRVNQQIPVMAWDNSKLFERVYSGDKYITRVYKLKTQL